MTDQDEPTEALPTIIISFKEGHVNLAISGGVPVPSVFTAIALLERWTNQQLDLMEYQMAEQLNSRSKILVPTVSPLRRKGN